MAEGDRYFGIAEEATFKTEVAAAKYINISRENIVPDQGWIMPETCAHRGYTKKVLGAFRARGNIEFPVEPENGIGWLLKWVLGNVSSAELDTSGVYKHTYKSANTIRSFTGRVGADKAERTLGGCLVNSLALRFAHGVEVREVAEIFASKETKGTIGSPTFSALDPFVFSQAVVEFGDQEKAIVIEGEVRINNRIPFDRGVLGDRYFPWIRVGKLLVDGRLSMYFEDTDQYDAFLAGTEFKLEILTTGPAVGGQNYALNVIMTKCQYLRDTAPHVDRREMVVVDAPFQAFYDPTPETEITLELQNQVTSYPDAT